MAGFIFSNSAVQYATNPGQVEFTGPAGTYTWIVPNGIWRVSAVVIGGGGGGHRRTSAAAPGSGGGNGGDLCWVNDIPVIPGELYNITIGAGGAVFQANGPNGGSGGETYITRVRDSAVMMSANGGGGGLASTTPPVQNGRGTGPGAVLSGLVSASGSYLGGTSASVGTSGTGSGGGGTAGYSGDGGRGGRGTGSVTPSTNGSGGGGGGGAGSGSNGGGGGGGTFPYGQQSDGTAGATQAAGGFGFSGSGGSWTTNTVAVGIAPSNMWAPNYLGQMGGLYGGGGGGLQVPTNGGAGYGARGCARIIWGPGRAFPSTNTEDYDNTTISPRSQALYTTPGTYTWTVPSGVTKISIVAIGAGEAGLQSTTNNRGGGGGATICATIRATPGESYTVVVGAGGTTSAYNVSSAGGNTSLTRNVTFRGYISGTTLTIMEVLTGRVTRTMTIAGSGVTSTTISDMITGEYGYAGNYTIATSQTVGSFNSPITFTGTVTLLTAGGGGNTASGSSAGQGGRTLLATTLTEDLVNMGSLSTNYGGNGGAGGGTTTRGAGGGGAGGYAGSSAGGNGAGGNGANASSGAGATTYVQWGSGAGNGGPNGSVARGTGSGGGGVGLFGMQRESSARGGASTTGPTTGVGQQGSGGTDGEVNTGIGGTCGGGGAGSGPASYTADGRCAGGPGGLRITWGHNRAVAPSYVPDV